MLGTVLLVILILLLIGAIPAWPYSAGWGYGPTGLLGTVLIIILILILLGKLQVDGASYTGGVNAYQPRLQLNVVNLGTRDLSRALKLMTLGCSFALESKQSLEQTKVDKAPSSTVLFGQYLKLRPVPNKKGSRRLPFGRVMQS